MKLLLLKYNNYYNRILKGYDNIDGYKLAVGTSGYAEIGGVNFNPRDGINTYHTINTPFEFDYMLVFDDTEPYTIRSRWFVIDSQYENLLQRTVTLRRDVLYDYSGIYGTVPAFIEKGALAVNDTFIYNAEAMTANRILKKKVSITDETNSGWIVGYVAPNYEPENDTLILAGQSQSAGIAVTKYSHLNGLANSSYDLFVMPWGKSVTLDEGTYSISKKETMEYLSLLTAALGSALYDVQLLPFCPVLSDGFTVTSSGISNLSAKPGIDYSPIVNEGTTKTVIIWGNNETRTFTKSLDLGLPAFDTPITKKVMNQLYSCRLVSPNHAASYEFNPAKVYGTHPGGSISVVVAYTMRPYNPYIRVAPYYNAGGLYYSYNGKETRALICQGDFSLPQVGDAWKQFQINNKNYLNAFNRQIDNLEIHQDYERTQQALSIASGAIGGAVGGAVLGGGVGGVVGGMASVAGGLADYAMSEKLRNETMDYTKDMFAMNCQNIQAQPHTISKVCSFDVDSYIFPYCELYTASDEEEAAFRSKIEWNGMTVGRIGTFNDFKSRASTSCRYIKAQIIRMADLHEELHTAKAISDELYKGVYIY